MSRVAALLLLAWRQNEVPATVALVETGGPDVLRVDERHQVDRIGIGGKRLILPVREVRPADDLVEDAFGITVHRLVHEIVVDQGRCACNASKSAS
jgi:hypothetical protein